MKNAILALVFLSAITTAFTQNYSTPELKKQEEKQIAQQTQTHNGKWVLSKIESDAIVTVQRNKMFEIHTSVNENNAMPETMQIPLQEYLKKEMTIGITNFIFEGETFQFSRSAEPTFNGKWTLDGTKMTLFYTSAQNNQTKENKIIEWTTSTLEIESISNGYNVKFTFSKN